MKTLTVSNNDLSDIDPRLAVLDSLVRIALEGNPLRSLKPAIRNAGAVELKKYLKMRLGDDELFKEEKKQAQVLLVPGANAAEADPWEILLREFVQGTTLDLKGRVSVASILMALGLEHHLTETLERLSTAQDTRLVR